MNSTMIWKTLLLIQIQIILALQCISSAEVDVEEMSAQIRSHLAYTARRLRRAQSNFDPYFANDLEDLLKHYTNAANAKDPIVEQKVLLEFESKQRESFKNYLTKVYDEQFLEVDIRIQEWSMRELLAQLDGALAEEIRKVLPAYDKAAKSEDFQAKYDAFSDIQEGISEALWALLDAQPEHKSLTNTQLKFFREFLLYLQKQNDAKEYAKELQNMLGEVEMALATDDMRKKYEVILSFDDVSTKYGRYLDYKVIEFEFDNFML